MLWKHLEPPGAGPAGAVTLFFSVNSDETAYAYGYLKARSSLYLSEVSR